jgi:hypothetical protein
VVQTYPAKTFIWNRSDWPGGFFLFHRYCHICIRRKPNLVAFHVCHQAPFVEVMMALMSPLAAIRSRQLDAPPFDVVDRPDVYAVSANYFHVFFNNHLMSSVDESNVRKSDTFNRNCVSNILSYAPEYQFNGMIFRCAESCA